jgi:hypothetical protein
MDCTIKIRKRLWILNNIDVNWKNAVNGSSSLQDASLQNNIIFFLKQYIYLCIYLPNTLYNTGG